MAVFTGRTEDGQCPILRQGYWSKGITLTGKMIRKFRTKNGDCYEFKLPRIMEFPGREIFPESSQRVERLEKIGIGEMAGFKMALAAAGLDDLIPGDIVELTCTGEQDTGQQNKMTCFTVKVQRPDDTRSHTANSNF
jgi:hypothetical protein